MAFIRGGIGTVLVDNVAGTPVDITAYVDSVEWGERSRDVLETTSFSTSGGRTYIAGLADGTLSINGKFDATVGGPDKLFNDLLDSVAGTGAGTVTWRPEGNGTGKPQRAVEAICTAYTASAPVGEIVTFSASFQMSGNLTSGAQI